MSTEAKALADAVRAKVDELNSAVAAAANAGVEVELDVVDIDITSPSGLADSSRPELSVKAFLRI